MTSFSRRRPLVALLALVLMLGALQVAQSLFAFLLQVPMSTRAWDASMLSFDLLQLAVATAGFVFLRRARVWRLFAAGLVAVLLSQVVGRAVFAWGNIHFTMAHESILAADYEQAEMELSLHVSSWEGGWPIPGTSKRWHRGVVQDLGAKGYIELAAAYYDHNDRTATRRCLRRALDLSTPGTPQTRAIRESIGLLDAIEARE